MILQVKALWAYAFLVTQLMTLLIKDIKSLLEAIRISLGLLSGSAPLFSPIGPGGWELSVVQQRLDVVLYVPGLILARISPHGPTVHHQELLKVAPNPTQPIWRPAGALNPSPERMGSRAEKIDLVSDDGGRVDPVSVFLGQLQPNELGGVGLLA